MATTDTKLILPQENQTNFKTPAQCCKIHRCSPAFIDYYFLYSNRCFFSAKTLQHYTLTQQLQFAGYVAQMAQFRLWIAHTQIQSIGRGVKECWGRQLMLKHESRLKRLAWISCPGQTRQAETSPGQARPRVATAVAIAAAAAAAAGTTTKFVSSPLKLCGVAMGLGLGSDHWIRHRTGSRFVSFWFVAIKKSLELRLVVLTAWTAWSDWRRCNWTKWWFGCCSDR